MIPTKDIMSDEQIDAVCREHSGNKINATKIVRQITGLGLKESKDKVEASWARQGMSYPV